MSNTDATNRSLTDEEIAFMASFKNTHSQYEFTEKVIVAFLRGTGGYFDGYTQLADASNLWADAIVFARRSTSKASNLRAHDREAWLDTIWSALHAYREDCIPESDPMYDNTWGDVCTAMAWIEEDLAQLERRST